MERKSSWQVGINAHLLSRQASYRSAGVHGYIHNLIHHLPSVQEGDDLCYRVFVGDGEIEPTSKVAVKRSSWPTGRPAVRILWEQTVLPLAQLDLLHSMAFVTPLISRWPTVITVYDLSFIHYPDALTFGRRLYLRLFTQLSCQRAARIISISKSTRRDLVKQWKIPAGKIDVAYPGVGDHFRPLPADQVTEFRCRLGLPKRFILHLGTLQPRKNLVRLVQAYSRLQTDAKLILVGSKGWLYQEILAEIERLNLQDDVILAGYVKAEELPLWYNAASVLVYPSLYEGFGMPVTEAMACRTPVVTSNVSSMPEAAGGAEARTALLVDPYNTEALVDALHRVLTDKVLVAQMQAAGAQQASKFSWQKTADATVQCYQTVLELRENP